MEFTNIWGGDIFGFITYTPGGNPPEEFTPVCGRYLAGDHLSTSLISPNLSRYLESDTNKTDAEYPCE